MKSFFFTLPILLLAAPPGRGQVDDEIDNVAIQIGGFEQYDPNNFSNNYKIIASLDGAAYEPLAEVEIIPRFTVSPDLIGTFYTGGTNGTIVTPDSARGFVRKPNAQYNPFQAGNGDPQIRPDSARDLWDHNESAISNSISRSGRSSYFRGEDATNVTLFIRAEVTGRYVNRDNEDNDDDFSDITTIIGLDDPSQSSWTGLAIDRTNPRQRTADNAINISHFDRRNDRNLGSYTFVEGNYFGGEGFEALFVEQATDFTIRGASFIGGEEVEGETLEGDLGGFGPAGAVLLNVSSVNISNRTGIASDRFEGGRLSAGNIVWDGKGLSGETIDYSGGEGLVVNTFQTRNGGTKPGADVTIQGGDFLGSTFLGPVGSRSVDFNIPDMHENTLDTSGGDGAALVGVGAVNISGARFIGGPASHGLLGGQDSYANAHGGNGLFVDVAGSVFLSNAVFEAGDSASAGVIPVSRLNTAEPERPLPPSAENSIANASGGSGIVLVNISGSSTLTDVTARGSAGVSAFILGTDNTLASATGGHGVFGVDSDIVVDSGTYTGADGGVTSGGGLTDASGGAGIYIVNGELMINGGTFTGGSGGRANRQGQWGGAGLWIENSDLVITESGSNAVVNGHLFINGSSDIELKAGRITGDIYSFGSGDTSLSISNSVNFQGLLAQFDGSMTINLNAPDEAAKFSDVYIGGASLAFTNLPAVTATNARFTLANSNSSLAFSQGATLSKGTALNVGRGQVEAANGNLVLDGARINLAYNPDATNAPIRLASGGLIFLNDGRLSTYGAATAPAGSIRLVDAMSPTDFGTQSQEEALDISPGWLTSIMAIDASAGLRADYDYRSLTNVPGLSSLNTDFLLRLDRAIVRPTTNIVMQNGASSTSVVYNTFRKVNQLDEARGTGQIRFTETQAPDVADSVFKGQHMIAQQIVARATEFRARHGFAAATLPVPQGVAGPKAPEDEGLQGWLRVYGSVADRKEEGDFPAYDGLAYGTVIGLDQRVGPLLLGISGGQGSTEADADGIYDTDTSVYHGSIYASLGNESLFLDLAFTRAWADTETRNVILDDDQATEFESTVYSGYIGIGKAFGIGKRIQVTPEASALFSFYNQDEYTREGLQTQKVHPYESTSTLASFGCTIASNHQIDWYNRGLAMIPELRFRWLHEFDPDLDRFSYTADGETYSFAVRPREENFFEVGAGLDLWSWHHYGIKLELDYDLLFGSDYTEHTLSGRITYHF